MPHESRSRLCVNKNIGCGIPFFINSVIKTIDCVKFKKKKLCRLDFLPALQLQVDEAACYNKNEFNAILTITAQINFYYRRLVYVEQTTYQMRHFHVCIIFSHKYIIRYLLAIQHSQTLETTKKRKILQMLQYQFLTLQYAIFMSAKFRQKQKQ